MPPPDISHLLVRPERTGWRDQEISERHRKWGWNCPAVDLDFLMVEYNVGKPVGIVEYKHFQARMPNLMHPTYRALCELADSSGLPFLLAFYWPDRWAFVVHPVNLIAQQHFDSPERMTERDFVLRLYRLRRLVLHKQLVELLNTELPPESDHA